MKYYPILLVVTLIIPNSAKLEAAVSSAQKIKLSCEIRNSAYTTGDTSTKWKLEAFLNVPVTNVGAVGQPGTQLFEFSRATDVAFSLYRTESNGQIKNVGLRVVSQLPAKISGSIYRLPLGTMKIHRVRTYHLQPIVLEVISGSLFIGLQGSPYLNAVTNLDTGSVADVNNSEGLYYSNKFTIPLPGPRPPHFLNPSSFLNKVTGLPNAFIRNCNVRVY